MSFFQNLRNTAMGLLIGLILVSTNGYANLIISDNGTVVLSCPTFTNMTFDSAGTMTADVDQSTCTTGGITPTPTPNPNPTPTPNPTPAPTPTPTPGGGSTCSGAGLTIVEVATIASGRNTYQMREGEVISFPLVVSQNTGQADFVYSNRTLDVSIAADNDPCNFSTSLPAVCLNLNNAAPVMRWYDGVYPGYCTVPTGTQFRLNVKGNNCSSAAGGICQFDMEQR